MSTKARWTACAGNLVPDSVPVDDDEDHNPVVDTFGTFESEDYFLSHYDLIQVSVRGREGGEERRGGRARVHDADCK